MKFQGCFNEVSRVFQGSLRGRVFEEITKGVQVQLTGISSSFMGFQGYLKEVQQV